MSEWFEIKERGSSALMNFMIGLCQRRHRWLVNFLLYPITAYFFITSHTARRASAHFFIRTNGKAYLSDYFRQLLCFSRVLIDRVTILQGDSEHFKIRSSGHKILMKTKDNGQGIIMLGSHLGSFEACKLFAKDRMDIDIHPVAYLGGSAKTRQALDAINPNIKHNFIDPTEPDSIYQMRDVIDRGGILAILSDRSGIGERTALVNFLGESTYFPTGAYYLASILDCPVYCFFGMRVDNYLYDIYAIKLAENIKLDRGKRGEQAKAYAQQYANLLAEKAKKYPYNWFNFYEFWRSEDSKTV